MKNRIDEIEYRILRVRQYAHKYLRAAHIVPATARNGRKFAICCVKRTEYVKLAIENCNSLHFHNPNHEVSLYLDATCHQEYERSLHLIHYPSKVNALLYFKNSQPWQISKVQVLIDASKKGAVLTDADGIWRADPAIAKNAVTFLVPTYTFSAHTLESKLVAQLQGKEDWSSSMHFVTGLVAIPPRLLTSALARDMIRLTKAILLDTYTFRCTKKDDHYLRRLAEEIGVSLAVQRHIPKKALTTLKATDGPGSRQILQSMYYGCRNEILS